MYKLVVKDIRQKTSIEDRQPYFLHITQKTIRLSKHEDIDLRPLAYYNRTSHTIYLFFTNEHKEWHLTPDYTPLYTIDNHLDLSSFNVVRYFITGDIEATIENYTSTYVNMSTSRGSRVRLYVAGSHLSVRTSVRSRSRLSICGSANTLEIRSLHADSHLDLTAFNGGHLYRNEVDVVQQSILCGVRFADNEETTRQRYVQECIRLPLAEKRENTTGKDPCLLCYDRMISIECRPCGHSSMCLACTRSLHEQPQSLFTCPLCREEIQEVKFV